MKKNSSHKKKLVQGYQRGIPRMKKVDQRHSQGLSKEYQQFLSFYFQLLNNRKYVDLTDLTWILQRGSFKSYNVNQYA